MLNNIHSGGKKKKLICSIWMRGQKVMDVVWMVLTNFILDTDTFQYSV